MTLNEGRTVQVIVQIQVGCRAYCDGTVQVQTAVQGAATTQEAVAAETAAVAVNVSVTEQFVWQLQLGCVAFCSNTTQTQAAVQVAATTQTASGVGALNVATTTQRLFQHQQGCREACVSIVQTQTGSQQAATQQVAAGVPATTWRRSPFSELDVWLRELRRSNGVTIQIVRQFQFADCLARCSGTAQTQTAEQQATTTQRAVPAVAGPPPVEVVSD